MEERKEAWQEICEKGERLRSRDVKQEGGMGEGWKNREMAWGLNKCNLPSSLLTNPSLLQHKGRSNSRTMCVPHHQLTVMAAWRRGGNGGEVKGGGRGCKGDNWGEG